jgi:hypothetical protein
MEPDELDLMETIGRIREVTAELVGSADLGEALDRLADLAAQLAPGRTWCGISLLRDGQPALAARSADLPPVIEHEQYRRGEGPCLTAMVDRDVVSSPDLSAETRWPRWSRLAVSHGARAVTSYPLTIEPRISGALNLYQVTAEPMTNHAHLTALLVAEHAGLQLRAVMDRSRYRAQVEELQRVAGSDRTDVDRAVGILMAQRGCDVKEAFVVLDEAAAALGADVTSVATKLVSTVAARAKAQTKNGGTAQAGPSG